MKQSFILFFIVIYFGTITGCAYFQKKDEPPPLPPIEETKPPLKLKPDHFKEFPWADLAKPTKDGNDPNTKLYTWRDGDTFESVAESEMGNPALGTKLALYNDLGPGKPIAGDKIVIPNAIIGLTSQIVIKHKKEREFGSPENLTAELKAGDEYKFRFESNVNGFLYAFKEDVKGVDFLYPAKVKIGARNRKKEKEPIMRDTGKIEAHTPLLVPSNPKGISYDPKKSGDRVFVFLSLRQIPELDDLKEKKSINVAEIEDVMLRVKQGDIVSEGAVRVLRIADPSEVLGFTLSVGG